MDILLLKLCLAPLLVVASALAGRRWGPDHSGLLVGLPIVAGPILFISYQLHGADFAAGAAESSLLGLVSLAVFALVCARAARRFGWPGTVAVSWLAVLVADVALSFVRVTAPVAFAVTVAATVVAMALMPRAERPDEVEQPPSPSWDLPGRAAATGVLVLVVTTASGALGPQWTGLLAPFPIATTVVAAFVHAQRGAAVTARTLNGVLVGLFSFAVFCLSVAVLVRPVGGLAFLVGVVVTIGVQLLVLRARRALRSSSRVA